MHTFLLISMILISMAVLFIILYYTPLRYLVLFPRIGQIMLIYLSRITRMEKVCKKYGFKTYPILPKDILKKYGLSTIMPAWRMERWEKMNYGSQTISVTGGFHCYSVGKKSIWGKSSFLDPTDEIRYQLWFGMYIIPLDSIYEIVNDKKVRISTFGFNKETKEFNPDIALLLIQYDVYTHLDFIGKYLPKEYRHDPEEHFKLRDLKVKAQSSNGKYVWRYKGSVNGKSMMYYSKELSYMALNSLSHFGWIGESNEKNFSESKYKGDLLISYIDDHWQSCNPENPKAKFLSIGYSFGIYWDDMKKETPDKVMKELVDSYAHMKIRPIMV